VDNGEARSRSVLGHSKEDDPFYMKVADLNNKMTEDHTPRTLASANDANTKLVVGKNPKNGLKMASTEQDMLNHIHEMRLKMFDIRANDPHNEKPYLPMLSSDEKELIME
jgi:hypothetical protein